MRWLSHLDTQKAFERTFRRAQIPLKYSEGFNPHPKIAFASALAVGVVSQGEYFDVELAGTPEPAVVAAKLQESLPVGLRVFGAVAVPPGTPALMAVVNRARYRVQVALNGPVTAEQLQTVIRRIWLQDSWLVERVGKRGPIVKDIRPGVFALQGEVDPEFIVLDMLVQTGSAGNVRPEEVVDVLLAADGLPVNRERVDVERLGLFVAQGDRLLSPLAIR